MNCSENKYIGNNIKKIKNHDMCFNKDGILKRFFLMAVFQWCQGFSIKFLDFLWDQTCTYFYEVVFVFLWIYLDTEILRIITWIGQLRADSLYWFLLLMTSMQWILMVNLNGLANSRIQKNQNYQSVNINKLPFLDL